MPFVPHDRYTDLGLMSIHSAPNWSGSRRSATGVRATFIFNETNHSATPMGSMLHVVCCRWRR